MLLVLMLFIKARFALLANRGTRLEPHRNRSRAERSAPSSSFVDRSAYPFYCTEVVFDELSNYCSRVLDRIY